MEITKNDVIDALRNSAMLAEVKISLWSGHTSDDEAVDIIRTHTGAGEGVGRFVKRLLAGKGSRLKAIHDHAAQVRAKHYAVTLPYSRGDGGAGTRTRGPRLLPSVSFLDYVQEFAAARTRFNTLVDDFVANYDADVAAAIAELGSLGKADEYPTADAVKERFKMSIDLNPLPTTTAFPTGLPDGAIKALAKTLEDKTRAITDNAVRFALSAYLEEVERASSLFADPEAKFKVNTIAKLDELPDRIRRFNITRDPRQEELADKVQRVVGYAADDIRGDAQLRARLAGEYAAIAATIKAWGI